MAVPRPAGRGRRARPAAPGQPVAYGLGAQRVEPLRFGSRRQQHAPDLAGDLAKLLAKRSTCFYVEEDASERGIDAGELLEGLVPISRAKLATLFSSYDQVHRW